MHHIKCGNNAMVFLKNLRHHNTSRELVKEQKLNPIQNFVLLNIFVFDLIKPKCGKSYSMDAPF